MGTHKVMNGLILYFVGLLIITSLFSIAGVFREREVVTNANFQLYGTNSSQTGQAPSPSVTPLSWKSYFKDIFSFFVWNISIYDGDVLIQYLWLIRIIFVYLPLTFLMVTIWYSIPTVSG